MKRLPIAILAAATLVACSDADYNGYPSEPDASVPTFDAGSLADASSAQDANVAVDAGFPTADAFNPQPDAALLPCQVLLRPVSAPDLNNLAAGPDAFVRVRGEIVGAPRPTNPQWNWQASFQGQGLSVADPDSSDPALIRLPLERPGGYNLSVSVADGCSGSIVATAVLKSQRQSFFILRLIPPPETGLPPQDIPEQMLAGTPKQADLRLAAGHSVRIIPQNAAATFTPPPLVPAFVRIFSNVTSFDREGVTIGPSGFHTQLSSGLYNVLIVPQDTALAPLLVRDLSATNLGAFTVDITAGALVQGTVTVAGTPLAAARLMLRRLEQPSTLGTSAANGTFSLRARPGMHALRVLGPPDAALPILQVDEKNGISITSAATSTITVNYADLAKANLLMVVRRPSGVEAATGTVVQLVSDVIADAATLTVGQVAPRSLAGHVEFKAVVNDEGVAAFPALPRARYQALLRPPGNRAWAAAHQTPLVVDLRSGDQSLNVNLATTVTVTGQLTTTQENLAGLRVSAVEETNDPAAEEALAAVTADGKFSLSLSPETTYRLRVAPPLGRLVPQIVFGSIRTTGGNQMLPLFPALPPALRFSGRVLNNAGVALPGTVLQAFCTNNTQDCIDSSRPNVGLAVPISEAVAGPDGAFVLVLPDPSG